MREVNVRGNNRSRVPVSDIELDTTALELHPENDTGIIAMDQRSASGGVTGLSAAFVAEKRCMKQ